MLLDHESCWIAYIGGNQSSVCVARDDIYNGNTHNRGVVGVFSDFSSRVWMQKWAERSLTEFEHNLGVLIVDLIEKNLVSRMEIGDDTNTTPRSDPKKTPRSATSSHIVST